MYVLIYNKSLAICGFYSANVKNAKAEASFLKESQPVMYLIQILNDGNGEIILPKMLLHT